MRPSDCGST
uniref:Uncharacterized protein n=1 Tax=Rhizophora mucronata TaxID=61149 RepID=A0A2P2ITB7_RHIMU